MKALSKYRLAMAAMLVFGLIATVGPATARAQSSDQVALIGLSSLEEIAQDIDFVGQLIDQPEISQQFAAMSMMFAGSLDRKQPIGVALYAEGETLGVLVMLPVSQPEQLMTLLKGFEIPIEEGADGVMEINIQGQTIYAQAQKGWILAAQNKDQLASAPTDPGKLISVLTSDYDLGARIYVQNIPADLREKAIQGLKAGIDQGMQREPNETEEQYVLRKSIMGKQIEGFEQALQEMEELTIGWSLDNKQARIYFDFVIKAVAGSKLAQQTTAYGEATTDFAGFYQPDAAATLTLSSVMSQEEIDQAMEVLTGFRTQIMNQIENEADLPDDKAREIVKSAVGDFYDALVATVRGGKADAGAVMLLEPDAMTIVAGGLCNEPGKIKQGLKKLEALAEDEPDFPGIQWDADRHGDISFHTMQIPIPDQNEDTDKAKKVFGEELEVAFGTGETSLYFALGRNAVANCKKIIDSSKANPGKSVPPIELTISLAQIMTTLASLDDDPVVAKIADMLQNEAADRDHIRITAKVIERGIQYRIEAEEGVLKAIGTAVQMNAGS